MGIHTITLQVPDDVFHRLTRHADATKRTVEDILVQAARQAIPPTIEPDLPQELQIELAAMDQLSDEALWAIARGVANSDKIALYDVLLERNQSGTITPEGIDLLRSLREETDALMIRKAHAFVLLKNRGYSLPDLHALPVPSS